MVDHRDGAWEMLLCCQPLDLPGEEDRMMIRRLTSRDGLTWSDRGEVLTGRPGAWDAPGDGAHELVTVVRRPGATA